MLRNLAVKICVQKEVEMFQYGKYFSNMLFPTQLTTSKPALHRSHGNLSK